MSAQNIYCFAISVGFCRGVVCIAHTLTFTLCTFTLLFTATVHALEVRYHTQVEVEQLRKPRRVGEGRGRGGGKDRGSRGGRGEAGVRQMCDEIEAGRRQGPVYANIKVMM